MSPYRAPPTDEPVPVEAEDEEPCPDADLLPVFVVLWIGSWARVVPALTQSVHFDAEATLAAIALVVVPCLVRGGIAWTVRRMVRALP